MTFFMDMLTPEITKTTQPLVDSFGREVNYLRVSVTDRCDFRCTYCMSENMKFLPKKDVLSFEELNVLIDAFVARGVKKIRLTGGEPLVRRDIMDLISRISLHFKSGCLNELTLTTNGSQLVKYAKRIRDAGIERINVSLDTMDAQKFADITRRGRLEQVLAGIKAADSAGLAIKLNMVAMKGFNDAEIVPIMRWAHERGYDLTLIEEMPLGDVSRDRAKSFLPLHQVRDDLVKQFTLDKIAHKTGGPARYVRVKETGGRLGFITPMSHNFCESCNRVRLTCTGQLYLCLGREGRVDLRGALRDKGASALDEILDRAMALKPRGHDFDPLRQVPAVDRHMSTTGG